MTWQSKQPLLTATILGGMALAIILGLNLAERYVLGPHTAGILDLQFAFDAVRVYDILLHWPKSERSFLLVSLLIDGPLIACYAGSFFIALKTLNPRPDLQLEYLPILAGVADLLENLGTTILVYGHASNGVAMATSIFALLKWLLIMTTGILISLLVLFRSELKR